jgi:hypothetical protein
MRICVLLIFPSLPELFVAGFPTISVLPFRENLPRRVPASGAAAGAGKSGVTRAPSENSYIFDMRATKGSGARPNRLAAVARRLDSPGFNRARAQLHLLKAVASDVL